MIFPIRMAWREIRRSRRKFVFFLLCIAIGVAGLVGVKGFNANLQHALLKEARTLMAADMQMSLNRPPTDEQLAVIDGLADRGIAVAYNIETATMSVNPQNRATQLVEVKAVDSGYPFYGVLEVEPAGAVLTDQSALVAAELLDRIGLQVGDSVRLGAVDFVIAGVILKEPDRVTATFGFGPRVMLTRGGLERADLIRVGSRANHIFLFKLAADEQVEPVRAELKAAFARERPRIADFREAQPQVKRILDRMSSFLGLVSMIALLVGGLGVANATRVYIQQKLDAIAIMKCLGATNRRVLGVYLTQMLLLSLAGSALGVALGFGIQLLMPSVVGNFLDLNLEIFLSPEVALQGLTVGLLTSVLFTLLPLSRIADVKPALVFRREMAENQPRAGWGARLREGLLYLVIGVGLGLIASWISGSLKWGFWFMGGLTAAVLLLGLASYAAVWLVRQIRTPRGWIAARQGLANLHRPGSQAGAVVLALGVGVTLVLAIYLMQRGLLQEVQLSSPAGAPNLFFVGLTRPDAERFDSFLRAHPGVESVPDLTPIIRGRIVRLDGKGRDQLELTQAEERWFNFQFNLTYSEELPTGNDLPQGRWWKASDYTGRKLVSVEQEAANRLKLAIGSVIEFELEGSGLIQAEVFNIRRALDFRAGGAFNFVFAPGALDDAPVSYLAQARGRPEALSAVQRDVVAAFPGVTVINLNDVLETVGEVIDQIGMVIRFVAAFSVAAGLIILASSIAATKFRRTREAVLYKTLGASRGRVWRIFAVEYAALGVVAGLVGVGLAAVAAWAILTYLIEARYTPELMPLVTGFAVTVLLTVVVGVVSTLDVLAAKPLQVLREE